MGSLHQNLTTLIKRTKLTPTELARRTQVAQPIIHRLCSGKNRNPKLNTLKPLGNYLQVSTSQLIGETPLPDSTKSLTVASRHHWCYWRLVPQIRWEDATEWPKNQRHYHTNETTSYFCVDIDVSDTTYALTVDQHSTLPQLPKGATLVADPKRNAENQDVVIVQFEGKSLPCLRRMTMSENTPKFHHFNEDLPNDHNERHTKTQARILAVVVQSKVDFY